MHKFLRSLTWIWNGMPNSIISFSFVWRFSPLVNVNCDRTCPVQPESVCLFSPTDSIDPSAIRADVALANPSLWWVVPWSPWGSITMSQGEYLAPSDSCLMVLCCGSLNNVALTSDHQCVSSWLIDGMMLGCLLCYGKFAITQRVYKRDGIPFVDLEQRDSARCCQFPEFLCSSMTTRVKR